MPFHCMAYICSTEVYNLQNDVKRKSFNFRHLGLLVIALDNNSIRSSDLITIWDKH